MKSESGLLIPVVLDDLANELEHELDPLPDSPLGRVGFSPLPIVGQGDTRLRDVKRTTMDWDHRPNEREGRGESKSHEEQEVHEGRRCVRFRWYSFDTHRQVHSHVGRFEDRACLAVEGLCSPVHDNITQRRSRAMYR